jgi:hypothetical protein
MLRIFFVFSEKFLSVLGFKPPIFGFVGRHATNSATVPPYIIYRYVKILLLVLICYLPTHFAQRGINIFKLRKIF